VGKKIFLVGQIFGSCWAENLAKSWQQLIAQGRILKEVCNDPRIKEVWVAANSAGKTAMNHQLLPKMVLENIWAERFHVDYVQLPSGALAAHANQI